MENIIIATNDNFKEEIKNGLVLIDFYATWCGPCKMLEPILEQLAADNSSLKILKVDVDEFQEIAGEYGVMAMPTMKLLKDGEVIDEKVGVSEKEELQTWIDSK